MSVRKRTWQTSSGDERSAWVVDYVDQHGKRRLKSFARKKDADAWAPVAAVEVMNGVHTPDSDSITVAEAAEVWLEASRIGRDGRDPVEPHTYRVYKQHVTDWIVPRVGTVKLSRLTTPSVARFRDHLVEQCPSRATARKVLTSFKAIVNEAQARGLVAQNVARPVTIKVSSRHKEEASIPSREIVRTILATADQLAGRSNKQGARQWRRWLPYSTRPL